MPFNLFGQTSASLEKKITELQTKRAAASAELATVTQHLANLRTDLGKAELEFALEESKPAEAAIASTKARIAKFESQASELRNKIPAFEGALSIVRAKQDEVAKGEVEKEFERNCAAVIALCKDVEPIIETLARKATEIAERAANLQNMANPITSSGGRRTGTSTCNDDWNDAFSGVLAYQLKDALRPGIIHVMDHVSAGVRSGDGSLSQYMESQLKIEIKRVQLALTDSENRYIKPGSSSFVDDGELVSE